MAKNSVAESTVSKSKNKTASKQVVKKVKPKQANNAQTKAKPVSKLNYEEVLSEYSRVVSADILRDP